MDTHTPTWPAFSTPTPNGVVLVGDCLDRLRELPDASIDSVVTDPPYELGFMGKKWDASGIAYNVGLWAEVLRVLKPGGHLLAFGGTRTYHRMAVAIEDAGFEIRDSLHWSYSTGMPKSHDVSKAIDKAGGVSPAASSRVLRAARERSGMSRAEVAAAVGCTEASVRDWEEGRARLRGGAVEHITPSPEYRDALADLLGYSSDERVVVGAAPSRSGDGTGYGLGHTGKLTSGGHTPAAKRWEGWGTALKPAHEPIVVARKPLAGTVAACVLEHGTGALNIDACRIGTGTGEKRTVELPDIRGGRLHAAAERGTITREVVDQGRWPSNLLFTHDARCRQVGVHAEAVSQNVGASDEKQSDGWGTRRPITADAEVLSPVWSCVAGCPVAELDAQAEGASRFFPCFEWDPLADAAPFRYVAKPSKAERDAGLHDLDEQEFVQFQTGNGASGKPSSLSEGRDTRRRNTHPTVKPVALMRWLVRLVTPPGGVVLDPFLGSATTAVACELEGFAWVGCELTEEYLPIIDGRTAWAAAERAAGRADKPRFKAPKPAPKPTEAELLQLFS